MLYLNNDQTNKLQKFGGNILSECIGELELLDWAISMSEDREITQNEIDRTFEYYMELGREKYGDKD